MSGNEFAGFEFNFLPGYGAPTESSLLATFDDASVVKTAAEASSILGGFNGKSYSKMLVMPLENLASYDPASAAPSAAVVTYRLRGYYVGGSTYEFWTGTSPTTPNPSGNPLINKVIDSIL